MEDQIGASRSVLLNHNSMIKTQLRGDYEEVFEKNTFIEGDIDDALVQLRRDEDSESMSNYDVDCGMDKTYVSNMVTSLRKDRNSKQSWIKKK